jgi:ADP-heptose:LPS heptosyltransferase
MNGPPTSLLIFRNGSMGNTLVAVPAMRALRARWPAARFAVVVDGVGLDLLRNCPWIDELIVYEKRGRDAGMLGWLRLVRRLRAVRPSHAVLFKRFFRNGLLAFASGARHRIGFSTSGRAPFLTHTITYDETTSIIELNLRLVELLDARTQNHALELFVSPDEQHAALTWLQERKLACNYVAVHYGGQTADPGFMSLDRLTDLIRSLEHVPHFVLIGNGPREQAAAAEITRRVPRATSAVGVPLPVTVALVQGAAGFIGMNSGPAHLAAAARIPGIVFYRADDRVQTELVKWKPASERLVPHIVPREDADIAWRAIVESARVILGSSREKDKLE